MWAKALISHPCAETHFQKVGLLSPSTPHVLPQGAAHAVLGAFEVVPQLASLFNKGWGEYVYGKNLGNMLWRRRMQRKLPSSKSATVRLSSHDLPMRCVVNNFPKTCMQTLFRFFVPMLHNSVICVRPFPLVFGLIFALPPFFAAAAGLPLRLFARQMEKTPH